MAFQREKDPTQIPVQLNVKIPWQLREDITEIANKREMSLAALVRELIEQEVDPGLRNATKNAGATR